jgi:hypothetical protein
MNLNGEESPGFFAEPGLSSARFFASLRMTLHPVVARHDSAEAISWRGNKIATLRSQ